MVTRAMILAAGLGTRMRPLTNSMPKPLIPVAGKALIDWNLDWLQAGGIHDVVINSSYLAEQLEAHVQHRAQPRITISREGSPPLETGGGVKQALPLLGDEPFLTMNSDAILPLCDPHPIQQLRAAWNDGIDFLLLLVNRAQAIGWTGNGDFVMDGEGRIRRPQPNEETPWIFTGIECMHPRAFAGTPEGAFSLSRLWSSGAAPWYSRVRAITHSGPWLNVGDLAGLAVAERYFA